jgi:hypothetical protein
MGYGVSSNKGESAEQLFKAAQKLGIAEYVQSRGESVYETVRKEPLGKSWKRGYSMPEETAQPSFKGFGKEICLDEFSGKEIIFPRYMEPEREEDKEMYKRTHGAYEPGEPTSRKYDWPAKITRNEHFSFGVTDRTNGNFTSGDGAKTALTMDLDQGADGHLQMPRTRIVDRVAESYRQVANDRLGTSRNMLQGRPPLPTGHAYGLKSGRDNTHAGELMRGFYTASEQRPDQDLGKCTLKGRRNFHTKRPFGVPSVRHDLDIPPTHKRSIASSTNYGDDHSAFTLLYPSKFGFRGVADSDFFARRPVDEMRSLLEGAGYTLEDQDFRMLWDEGVQMYGDEHELVSLEVMLNILGHWMSVTGVKPGQSVSSPSNIVKCDTLLAASEGLATPQGAR